MAAVAPLTRPYVVIVINALHSGGAEKTVVALARELRTEYQLTVVGLLSGGPAEAELREQGVCVLVPEGRSGMAKLRVLHRLAALVRVHRPLAVITFLYTADFVGGAITCVSAPKTRIYWNIRNNVLTRGQTGTFSRAFMRIDALLSGFVPMAIVYCSALARQQHELLGYHSAASYVVENSLSAVPFTFDPAKRAIFRRHMAHEAFVFLFVGRFDPVKRVDLFIDACVRAKTAAETAPMRFVLAGRGMEHANAQLHAAIRASGIQQSFELRGYVSDLQELYSAADCLVVTSESEGSSNVIYEAIATRLQVLILATQGTESVRGYGVRRLPTRSLTALTEAMNELARGGVPPELGREPTTTAPVAEHPLAGFYRRLLASPC